MAKKAKETSIEIVPISMGRLECHILGETPMFMHRFSKKAREQLLFPKGRANSAEKQENLKHDPLSEFRECLYLNRDDKEPTLVHVPADAFSKGMAAAALRMPGASKTEILQLVSCTSRQINLYGVPQLSMDMVRSSDMAKTPDVRTRSIFPEWCCRIEVEFVSTLLKQNQIVNLLAAAGMIVGVGDWRPQKGGSFGKFRIVEENDVDYQRILKGQGRKAQAAAYQDPIAFNADTEELLTWFHAEASRREKTVPSTKKTVTPAAIAAKADKAASRANGKGKRPGVEAR
jgi:hypothetical protein